MKYKMNMKYLQLKFDKKHNCPSSNARCGARVCRPSQIPQLYERSRIQNMFVAGHALHPDPEEAGHAAGAPQHAEL